MKTGIMTAVLLAGGLAAGWGAAPAAAPVEQTVVYLSCTGPDGQKIDGSGVVISEKGHVLTAAHVAPRGSTCRGSIGVADEHATRSMILQPTVTAVDAALLRFVESRQYEFAPTCRLEDWMVRSPIRSAGFPGGPGTGVPLFFDGILSSPLPDADGFLDTSANSVEGMSGGPVFTKDLGGLIGVIAGASFNKTGNVVAYKILPVSTALLGTELQSGGPPCYRASRIVELPPEVADWKAARGEQPLGVSADEADCYLAGISGLMNDAEDRVAVEVRNGEYVLVGEDRNGGNLGASVRCYWRE